MGSNSYHLSELAVANFKRFTFFEMKGLGQINLIFGDNNTGKTTVLEALLLEEDPNSSFNSLLAAFEFRGVKMEDLHRFSSYFNDPRPQSTASFVQTNSEGSKIELGLIVDRPENKLRYTVKKYQSETQLTDWNLYNKYSRSSSMNVPFIPFSLGFHSDLVAFYSKYIQGDRRAKKQFVDDLQILVPDIENIEPSYEGGNAELIVYQKEVDRPLSLSFFGDGTLKLFRILAEIVVNRNKRLMIDEVDTGIHFSRMKEFWTVILKAAQRNNVQLFMTTHSDECIRFFVDVLKTTEFSELKSEARGISLVSLPDKTVKAYTYPFDHLDANVIVGNEVRGGFR